MSYHADDLTLLLPSFEKKVRQVISEMVDLGYSPVPFDTLRTPAEAAKLHTRGVGSKDSMHIYGVACDVICDHHGWDCARRQCDFYTALSHVAEGFGLVWGGRWRRRDLPHVQGCSVQDQDQVRAIKDPIERDTFVSRFLNH